MQLVSVAENVFLNDLNCRGTLFCLTIFTMIEGYWNHPLSRCLFIMSMTFDRKKRIGMGTYSTVHEGEFKPKKVAIKRFVLSQKSQIRIHSKKKKQQTATVVVQQPPPPKVVQPVIKQQPQPDRSLEKRLTILWKVTKSHGLPPAFECKSCHWFIAMDYCKSTN